MILVGRTLPIVRVVTMRLTILIVPVLMICPLVDAARAQGGPAPPLLTAPEGPTSPEASLFLGDNRTQSYSAFLGDTRPGAHSAFLGDGNAPAYSAFIGYLSDDAALAKGKGSDGKGTQWEEPAGFGSRAFAGVEYLFWWNKGRQLPPMVTTSPDTTPQAQAGVYGLPTTTVLFGDDPIGSGQQNGGRVTFGWWLDDCRTAAVGARTFGVERNEIGFAAASAGSPILAVPFFNDDPLVQGEDALLVAFPAVSQGSVGISTSNEIFGSEVFLRYMVDAGDTYRLDVIAGYHFTRMNDNIDLQTFIDDGVNTFDLRDVFRTSNEFHGGELGLLTEWECNRLRFSALGKISFGNMNKRVAISGTNTVTAGTSTTRPGGLFTQPTNIGQYEDNVTAWIPEANFKVTYDVTDRLSLSAGYTFIYWDRVVLAGDQIDRTVNATQLTGGNLVGNATPTFLGGDTDFWVQSIDLGATLNY